MNRIARLSILWGVLFFSSFSFAAGYIRFGGLYLSESSGQGTMSTTTRTLIEPGAGWISDKGWTVGGLYAMEKIKYDSGSADRTSMGPTVGWITRKEEGFYLLATYHYTSSLSPNMKGTGYQGDVGYKFRIRKLGLALQMSYKSFSYTRSGSADLNPPLKNTKIDPYAALFFEF